MDQDKRLMEASWWERLTLGETGSCSDGWGHTQQSFNPIFCWRVGKVSVPSLLFDLRPTYSRGIAFISSLFLFCFLFLSSAPLYGYPEIYLYTHLFGGHWSSFHFGVTMNKAAVIWVQLLMDTCSFFMDKLLRVEFPDYTLK